MATIQKLEPDYQIITTEMHTGGEPLRIVEFGYPVFSGNTYQEKREYIRAHCDQYRKLLMREPRGHFDMYGVILVEPDIAGAHLGAVFMHNEGYSTMCGHAVIALGRYAVDSKLVSPLISPETEVKIQCPCGLVSVWVEYNGKRAGNARFYSVPCYVVETDLTVNVSNFGDVTVDVSYGGAFYCILSANSIGLNLKNSTTESLVNAADAIKKVVNASVELKDPSTGQVGELYGTILTDGSEAFCDQPTANIAVFADRQVDRSPCGSGVSSRLALMYHKKRISLDQTRQFKSSVTGAVFKGKVVKEIDYGGKLAVHTEISGKGYYMGNCHFALEEDDPFQEGFLFK